MDCKFYLYGLCIAHGHGYKCPFDNEQQLDCEDYLTEMNCECDDEIDIDIKCPVCGSFTTVHISPRKLHLCRSGSVRIQDLFPELAPNEREVIQRGICNRCWNDRFTDGKD